MRTACFSSCIAIREKAIAWRAKWLYLLEKRFEFEYSIVYIAACPTDILDLFLIFFFFLILRLCISVFWFFRVQYSVRVDQSLGEF